LAKAFSVASWNVEHLGDQGPPARIANVVGFLQQQQADVIAIYEVEGRHVWRQLMNGLPGYSWFITEGQNTQQILLGTASDVTAFVTQKIEFKSRDAFMRPGALLTIRHDGHDYTLLFLHLASMPDPRGFGLRQDMVDRAFKFKGLIVDALAPTEPNFIFLGDLNSMGLDYVYGQQGGAGTPLLRDRAIAEHEIARLSFEAGKHGMRVLAKSRDVTWRSQSMKSNLDHVVAASQLSFTQFNGVDVVVRGWPELGGEQEQRDWTTEFSDHALLFFEVQEL
jgi:endonuclease/exonuclease/phosphatase family metal-dependent hydrolase